jgi:hypothetical protein
MRDKREGEKLVPRATVGEGKSNASTNDVYWPGVAHVTHHKIGVHATESARCPVPHLLMTLLKDDCSKRPLAMHISYNAPSFLSYMSVIVACALQTGCLPRAVVVERGEEFQSAILEKFFDDLGISLLDESVAENELDNKYSSCGGNSDAF